MSKNSLIDDGNTDKPNIDELQNINETSEFTENVKLLGVETPILGFDGNDINPANWQAQALANRTKWLKENLQKLSTEVVTSVNDKTGVVTLKFSDVGADYDGAAVNEVKTHVAETDPHTQYLTEDRAKVTFVSKDTSNKPNGYLGLDENGNIPADYAAKFEATYHIVANKEERLALKENDNITICLQRDENIIYYLDAKADPSKEINWQQGRSTELNEVTSVFGRFGDIHAESGDYNADKITETDDRKFVHPDDKTKWDGKQDNLVSGSNIRTINGETLLGAEDLVISTDSIGASEKGHTHTADEITPTASRQFVSPGEVEYWNAKQEKLESGKTLKTLNGNSLLGGSDIVITADSLGASKNGHTHKPSEIETDKDNRFVTDTQIKEWTAKQDALEEGTNFATVNGYSLLTGKPVVLSNTDVKADYDGAAADAVKDHVGTSDPHTQYLTENKIKDVVVYKDSANKPGGYIKINDDGTVSDIIVDLFKSRYEIVANKEERLEIKEAPEITICLQTDENRVYYLNPGLDPKTETNWIAGQDTNIGDVVRSFKGRIGDIDPKADDYNANLITETATRKFVSPDEKTEWSGKQNELVSGETLRTLNGETLLGGSNIVITADTLGASKDGHTHLPSEIKTDKTAMFVSQTEKDTWNAKQDELVSGSNIATVNGQSLLDNTAVVITASDINASENGHTHTTSDITDYKPKTQGLILNSIKAGTGVTLDKDTSAGTVTVNAKVLIAGESELKVVDFPNAVANQHYLYMFDKQHNYDLIAYALKKTTGATNQSYLFDTFTASEESKFNSTPGMVFDDKMHVYGGGTYSLDTQSTEDDFYYQSIPVGAGDFLIYPPTDSIIPIMTSDTTPAGNTSSASSCYDRYYAWWAFDKTDDAVSSNAHSDSWCGKSGDYPSESNPMWLRIDLAETMAVSSYSITNRNKHYGPSITSWKLQGSNNAGETWDTLHTVVDNRDDTQGRVRTFALEKTVLAYSSYRLLITDCYTKVDYISISDFSLYPLAKYLLNSGDNWYTVVDNKLKAVGKPTSIDDFYTNGFSNSGTLSSEDLTGFDTLSIVSPLPTKVIVKCIPLGQIAIYKKLIPLTSITQINGITVTLNSSGPGSLHRVAVSRDLINWYVYYNGAWDSIGALTTDTESANKLLSQNGSIGGINGTTANDWKKLFADNNNATDYIAFAYAIRASSPSEGLGGFTYVTLNVNQSDYWLKQTASAVNIIFNDDSVTFKPTTAGTYKFIYQSPL